MQATAVEGFEHYLLRGLDRIRDASGAPALDAVAGPGGVPRQRAVADLAVAGLYLPAGDGPEPGRKH